jgi:hypothetical protein
MMKDRLISEKEALRAISRYYMAFLLIKLRKIKKKSSVRTANSPAEIQVMSLLKY